MALVAAPSSWGVQKPPVGSQVRTGHPLTQGLAGAWLLDHAAFDVTGRSPGIGSPSNATFVPQGAVATTAAGYLPLRSTKLVGGEVNLTLMSFGVMTGTGPSGGRASYSERGSSGNDILKLGFTSGGGTGCELTYRNDGGTLSQLRGNKAINDGRMHQIVGRKVGTALTVWVDGILDNSATFGSASDAFTDATVEARALGDKGDNTVSWNAGAVSAIYVWRRALTDNEIRWLAQEPYAFITAPAPYRQHFTDAAAAPPPASRTSDFFAVF